MADTIVNNTPSTPQQQPERSDSSAGWAVAVIILIAIIALGGYYLFRHRAVAPASTSPAVIQVNLPSAGSGSGGTSGSTQ